MSNIISMSENKNVSIHEAQSSFVHFQRSRGISNSTIECNASLSKLFAEWCSQAGFEFASDLNTSVFESYVQHLYERKSFHHHNQKLQKSSIRRHVLFLQHFSAFLERTQLVPEDCSRTLVRPKASRRIIQAFSDEQVSAIFTSLKMIGDPKKRLQKTAIVYLFLDSGLRVSEALSLKPSNIDFHRRLIRVIGKGDKEREVPFSRNMSEIFLELIELTRTGTDQYIWISDRTGKRLTTAWIRSTLRKVKNDIGTRYEIDKMRVSPHTFRHTFAKNWIMQGKDTMSLRRILGHSSTATTEIYVTMWGDDLVDIHDSYWNPARSFL